jgi:hypothetical protein
VSSSVQFPELQAEGAVALRRGEAREAEPEERPALGGRGEGENGGVWRVGGFRWGRGFARVGVWT